MKLYADYLKETENVDCKYNDNCFITYKVVDNEVFILDAYSDSKIRGQQIMLNFFSEWVNEMKESGHSIIFSNSTVLKKGHERSDRLQKQFGFISMGKDINDNTITNYYYKIKENYNG